MLERLGESCQVHHKSKFMERKGIPNWVLEKQRPVFLSPTQVMDECYSVNWCTFPVFKMKFTYLYRKTKRIRTCRHSHEGSCGFNGGSLFFIQELSFDEGVRRYWSLQKWAVNNSLIRRAIKSCWRLRWLFFITIITNNATWKPLCLQLCSWRAELSSMHRMNTTQIFLYGQKLSTF